MQQQHERRTELAVDPTREQPVFHCASVTTEFREKYGVGSLHEAVRQKKKEILHDLCLVGIDVNAFLEGKTALTEAIERDDLESVDELLMAKADPCIQDEEGMSSLHVACEQGKPELAKKLLAAGGTKGIDDVYIDVDGLDCTSLMSSSRRGALPVVETLIAFKADVNDCDKLGNNAASRAVSEGSPAVLEALLKAGADVLHCDYNGRSLVCGAAWIGNSECLRVLIEAKACVLTPQENGDTPLLAAAFDGHIDAMRLLIEAKADASAKNMYGDTALHYAAVNSQDEAIKVLVIEGQARLDVKDECGKTPLQYAVAGSSTHALLTEMELVGADEHVLVKSAARRFKPSETTKDM